MRSTARLTDALRGRKKAVVFVGAAAALLGAGTASAAAVASAGHAPATPAHVSSVAAVHAATVPGLRAVAHHAADSLTPVHAAVSHAAAKVATAKGAASRGSAKSSVSAQPVVAKPVVAKPVVAKPVAAKAAAAAGKPAVAQSVAKSAVAVAANANPTWSHAQAVVASQTSPSEPKADNQLQPVGSAGAQAWMPISGSQFSNASAIVKQALAKKMGVRSAVIAVATAMQESQLMNINYGDRDSLGLFQQRPSCGWGTAQQILDPSYAANAFLTALQQHQASDPGWVQQPLWANAQAVQQSGFPFAYAKWETQAAGLVKQIVTSQVR